MLSRNYAPNGLHEADRAILLEQWSFACDLATQNQVDVGEMLPSSLFHSIVLQLLATWCLPTRHYWPYVPRFAAIARDMTRAKRPVTS